MIRLAIGSILGGIAQFLLGFLFWGTPLGRIPFTYLTDGQSADIQTTLARNLTVSGTGAYLVPAHDTAQGTVQFGNGPVALVLFNTHGFPLTMPSALAGGLALSILATFLLALALHAAADRAGTFATRMRIVVLVSVATALYFTLAQPVYNYYMPWGYFVYLALTQAIGLIAAGFVVAKWFLPNPPPPAA